MTKNTNIFILGFLQFCTKTHISVFCVFAFCVVTFVPIKIETYKAPQNDRLNSNLVKDEHVVGKKQPDMVIDFPFISCYFLGVHRTRTQLQVTSEAITVEPIRV